MLAREYELNETRHFAKACLSKKQGTQKRVHAVREANESTNETAPVSTYQSVFLGSIEATPLCSNVCSKNTFQIIIPGTDPCVASRTNVDQTEELICLRTFKDDIASCLHSMHNIKRLCT